MVTQVDEKAEVTKSSGNIFADLGFSNPEEAEAKTLLSIQIEQVMAEKGLTPVVVAQQMGLTEPQAMALIRGCLEHFTLNRLRQYLTVLKQAK